MASKKISAWEEAHRRMRKKYPLVESSLYDSLLARLEKIKHYYSSNIYDDSESGYILKNRYDSFFRKRIYKLLGEPVPA